MARLMYQGHGSYRIVTKGGTVVYVDPFAGKGYELPCDLALVTHEHYDHNKLSLLTMREDSLVLRSKSVHSGDGYTAVQFKDVYVRPVEAYNDKHKKEDCVGFLIEVDGVLIYAAGDTSMTEQMKSFSAEQIDYALLPMDGVFNMGIEEAEACAKLISAKHCIPIHLLPGALFSASRAEKFQAEGKIVLKPNDEIELASERDR